MVSSLAAEHQPWTSPAASRLAHPRGPQVERRHGLSRDVPVLDWQLHFSGGFTRPRELDMRQWFQYPRRNRSPPFLFWV